MPDQNLPTGNGMQARIARIDERTKHMAEKQDEHHVQLCEKLSDHEERIRKLERNTWWRDGAAALTGAVAGLVAGLSR